MTIELTDKSYIVGMWFSRHPDTNDNWLACVVKDPDNSNRYKGWSRFRYNKDDKIWKSHDEKSWSTFVSHENCTDEDMIHFMESLQTQIEEQYPDKDNIIVQGGLSKLMELAKNKPWMNLRHVPVEEVE